MASSGGGSQLPAPATGDKVHQSSSFHFPQREFGSGEAACSRSIKLRGEDWVRGYGHGSRSLAACSISAGIERDSVELHDGSA